jgi:hypothetical protein
MDYRVGFLRISADEVACESLGWSFLCILMAMGRVQSWVARFGSLLWRS